MNIDLTRKLPRPAGHHSITPALSVAGATKFLDFLQRAFGAKVVDKYEGPGGVIFHAEVLLGDSVLMFGEANKDQGHPAMPGTLSFYVDTGEAVDTTYQRALAAGAKSLMEPQNQFYGYRSATIEDASGNKWTICAVIEELTREEIENRMANMKH
jgi:PhnB protein